MKTILNDFKYALHVLSKYLSKLDDKVYDLPDAVALRERLYAQTLKLKLSVSDDGQDLFVSTSGNMLNVVPYSKVYDSECYFGVMWKGKRTYLRAKRIGKADIRHVSKYKWHKPIYTNNGERPPYPYHVEGSDLHPYSNLRDFEMGHLKRVDEYRNASSIADFYSPKVNLTKAGVFAIMQPLCSRRARCAAVLRPGKPESGSAGLCYGVAAFRQGAVTRRQLRITNVAYFRVMFDYDFDGTNKPEISNVRIVCL